VKDRWSEVGPKWFSGKPLNLVVLVTFHDDGSTGLTICVVGDMSRVIPGRPTFPRTRRSSNSSGVSYGSHTN
jgi:hypothetical protein